MNDFYFTFSSNISRNEYPNNTQSNFITNLVRLIELKVNYEVALAEINYSPHNRFRENNSKLQLPYVLLYRCNK